MRDGPRAVGITLLAALAASQAALVVLNPLLPDVARDLDVSVATAGQLRTVSGLAAGLAALATGLLGDAGRTARASLLGVVTLAVRFARLSAVGARLPRARSSRRCSSASASGCRTRLRSPRPPSGRPRRTGLASSRSTLLGPPLAWIVGMPLVGVARRGQLAARVARRSRLRWRSSRPCCCSGSAATPPATRARRASRRCSTYPGVARWSVGELLRLLGLGGRARLRRRAARRVVRPVDRRDGARARVRRARLRAREPPLPALGRRVRPASCSSPSRCRRP